MCLPFADRGSAPGLARSGISPRMNGPPPLFLQFPRPHQGAKLSETLLAQVDELDTRLRLQREERQEVGGRRFSTKALAGHVVAGWTIHRPYVLCTPRTGGAPDALRPSAGAGSCSLWLPSPDVSLPDSRRN